MKLSIRQTIDLRQKCRDVVLGLVLALALKPKSLLTSLEKWVHRIKC